MRCWDLDSVQEHSAVAARARDTNTTAHFGRLFALCVEKHSELPAHKRKYKGRVVFQGNNVRDENGHATLFTEQGSSASHLSASKLLDIVSMLPGNDGGQSDAPQAYTQALFNFGSGEKAVDTWVSLPKEEWPKEWNGRYRNPVVKLRLALYGHPLAGLFWERHYRQHLLEIGFQPVEGWECL